MADDTTKDEQLKRFRKVLDAKAKRSGASRQGPADPAPADGKVDASTAADVQPRGHQSFEKGRGDT